AAHALRDPAVGLPPERAGQTSLEARLDHVWVDVGAAADGPGILALLRDGPARAHDLALRLCGRACLAQIVERPGREHGARPGTEVLRGEVLARDVLEVLVDVVRVDGHRLAVIVDVLEEMLAR